MIAELIASPITEPSRGDAAMALVPVTPAVAGDVLDAHRKLHDAGQRVGNQAPDRVGRAAGRRRHDQLDRGRRDGLRQQRRRGGERRQRDEEGGGGCERTESGRTGTPSFDHDEECGRFYRFAASAHGPDRDGSTIGCGAGARGRASRLRAPGCSCRCRRGRGRCPLPLARPPRGDRRRLPAPRPARGVAQAMARPFECRGATGVRADALVHEHWSPFERLIAQVARCAKHGLVALATAIGGRPSRAAVPFLHAPPVLHPPCDGVAIEPAASDAKSLFANDSRGWHRGCERCGDRAIGARLVLKRSQR